MELQLISGRFAKQDAIQILSDIFKVKIAFHENKIQASYMREEDIKHAEGRIKDLQETVALLQRRISENEDNMIDIHAYIDISLKPLLT